MPMIGLYALNTLAFLVGFCVIAVCISMQRWHIDMYSILCRIFQLLFDVASQLKQINDWNEMKYNLGIIDSDCMAGGNTISDAENYRNILFMWWKDHGSDVAINQVLTELERFNPGAARRIRAQYLGMLCDRILISNSIFQTNIFTPLQDISRGELMPSGAAEFFSQLMKFNPSQTEGISKPTGLNNALRI